MVSNHRKNMDENALLAACLVGDPNAQRIFFDQFSSTMMGIALRYMKDEQLANDVLQETFIKAFENIHKFKNVGSLEGWLKKITVNTALDHLRKEKKFQFTSEIIDSSNELSYGENAVTKLQADDLMRIIQSLPDGYRTVFNLYAIEGYSHKEIAEILEITESTSKSQYSRAKSLLRNILEKHGIER